MFFLSLNRNPNRLYAFWSILAWGAFGTILVLGTAPLAQAACGDYVHLAKWSAGAALPGLPVKLPKESRQLPGCHGPLCGQTAPNFPSAIPVAPVLVGQFRQPAAGLPTSPVTLPKAGELPSQLPSQLLLLPAAGHLCRLERPPRAS